jgi:hypothetical protein
MFTNGTDSNTMLPVFGYARAPGGMVQIFGQQHSPREQAAALVVEGMVVYGLTDAAPHSQPGRHVCGDV